MSGTNFLNHYSLRVSDIEASTEFYVSKFGMKILRHKEENGYTQRFLAMAGAKSRYQSEPWFKRGGVVQLIHKTGESVTINNGNKEPHRGFGHICFAVSNLEAVCENLEKEGVAFQKKVSDGRQKNIAFALDPDGYWIELIDNGNPNVESFDHSTATMNHAMIRVKDKDVSIKFYTEVLGMTLVRESEHANAKFTLYFLSYDPDFYNKTSHGAAEGLVELTHNWGTESEKDFKYEGSDDNGFNHFGVAAANPEEIVAKLEAYGSEVQKNSNGTFTVYDPDHYKIEIAPQAEY